MAKSILCLILLWIFVITVFFLLKFVFSKKATKIDEIFTVDLTLCSKCQIDGEDFVNFRGLLRKYELYVGKQGKIFSNLRFFYYYLREILSRQKETPFSCFSLRWWIYIGNSMQFSFSNISWISLKKLIAFTNSRSLFFIRANLNMKCSTGNCNFELHV